MTKINQPNDQQWIRYIQTVRRQSQPVKIDAVLKKRMRSFVAARQRMLRQGKE